MTPDETVNEFIRRVVAIDLDGAAELVSDDLVYDNVPIGANHGPQAMKDLLSAMVKGVDEVRFITHRQTTSGNVVMNERTDSFRIGDRWIELPVAGVFEVDAEGKISLWRDFFDAATYFDQVAAATV